MGAKDSKPSFISYDEAVKRVSDSELRRIREAFKRSAGANGTSLSLEAFVHDVLCDGVPFEVAEWLYQACGGTKRGIAFKELLCGIVVLTKGNIEEKIKFLWTLYVNNQSDSGTYIYKWDLARALHIENSSLPFNGIQWSAEVLTGLFGSNERVTFDQFRSWLLIHKDATVLSKWLLSDCTNSVQNLETPTFYQSLAGVTHLEERDIIELEKCFWSLHNAAPTGQLDAESLAPLLSPPLPLAAVRGVFLALDENRDGHVDFKELCCGLSAACRGPTTERLKFCFKIFDLDRDGVLNKRELIDMIDILCSVAEESMNNQKSRSSTPSDGDDSDSSEKGFYPETILLNLRDKCMANMQKDGRKPVFQLGPTNGGEPINIFMEDTKEGGRETLSLTLEDFLIWSVETAEALVTPFLELIFEVCHIVLGLRPQCKHQEKDIVMGWLRREVHRGYAVGQFWYLVSAEWWAAWSAYGARGAGDACCRPSVRPVDEAIVCDESLTTESSESTGSLLWRYDSASLGSAASSSGVSSQRSLAPHPGAVDNKRLLAPGAAVAPTLTGEGGHLRRDVTLAQHRDFELVPDALWRALAHWYGGPDPLPRQVVRPPNSDVELELYPLQLQILRHVPAPHRVGLSSAGMGVGGGVYSSVPLAPAPPDTQLAYTAAFSRLATVRQVVEFLCAALRLAREDVRLWALGGTGGCATLLDDERPSLRELRLDERARVLLEVRNADLTWPEEIGALSGRARSERRDTLIAPDLPGATGLHNLGNTCYMNAALQAVWNTGPLTKYFNSDMHLYELNASNPLGTRGALALRFGELCQQVWACNARSVAPLRVRLCVSRWARHLAGGGQHDAQELLAWLLDALHEDLNRASPTSAAEATEATAESGARAEGDDRSAAAEAWAAHAARNQSVVTELFHGQLKSRVRCDACANDSVRFDAFNMLSLPLPLESFITIHVKVTLLDGSVPVKYGVRVNSEGTLADVKRQLSELCGLSCVALALVELSGARVAREWDDSTRVATVRASELHAYEVPPRSPAEHAVRAEPPASEAGAGADADAGADEVSPAQEPSSLCMPALFCFKRSRSEIAMGQSASSWRAGTLPRSRPAPAAELLRCGSSPADMQRLGRAADVNSPATGPVHYLFAVHRKQSRADSYFLPWQRVRAALFGAPLVVRVQEGGSGREVYDCVWAQLERLVSARPPPPERNHHNHAADCDDSLGYEFPFTLRAVRADAHAWCALCPWPALCRGCALPSDDAPLLLGCADAAAPHRVSLASASPAARAKLARAGELRRLDLGALRGAVALAVDWEPTALHLRYQPTREKECATHSSVQEAAAAALRAVDLAHCLRAFTSPERLEARYECARCRTKQPATKTLQIWRAPPILIIHLKRFQYVNNKWAKSQKVVNFPFEDFDPTAFLAAVPQETILRHRDLVQAARDESDGEPTAARRKRLESASLATSPVSDDALVDYHQHRLLEQQDPLELKYRLYAAVCHSGQMSGGHYVAYARNPNGAWLCYNDSSCREVAPPDGPPPNIDPASAYLLFYERRGLHYDSYLPAPHAPHPPRPPPPDDDEDARSACALA